MNKIIVTQSDGTIIPIEDYCSLVEIEKVYYKDCPHIRVNYLFCDAKNFYFKYRGT